MPDAETTPGVGKLVRDRIPQIIRNDGAEPVTYIAGLEEYRARLREKLGEEVAEFQGDGVAREK
ncbi:nucleoside triphosphate pyrophosphohydrolase [Streptomyces sp. NPDC054835]|uniref:nucleoside triphosphate pyrophosphohydrolase n=1 Tax=Streptomyces exfoliatus TaxID=1905 RepID=UPI0004B687CC|nr:nucleoside triphosphate pyrophosphohydrolase [Streptomyces exfoliatus]